MKKHISITPKEIYQITGKKSYLLKTLLEFLQKSYQPQEKQSYSKKSGWTIFYRKGGKALCYIHLKENGFVVTVVIGLSLTADVKAAKLSAQTKKMFVEAKRFYDGKWLNFDVKNKSQITDIKTLLLIKKPVKRV